MKKLSVTRRAVVGLTLSIAVLVLLILFSFQLYRNLHSSFDQVNRTHTVINELENLRYLLAQAELNVSEYVATNSEGYLQNFIIAYQNLQKKLIRVDSLTQTDPVQQARIHQLAQLITQREAVFLASINKNTGSREDSRQIILANRHKEAYREKIMAVMEEIKAAEQGYLRTLQQQTNRQQQVTFYVDLFGGLGAITLALITTLTLLKDHRERRQSEKALLELNLNKDKFFSVVSHDLRGAATNVVKLSEFLLEPDDTLDSATRREMATHLNGSADKLHKLLENLLSWAKLQMNRVAYQPMPLELQRVANETLTQLSGVAAAKGISLHNRVPASVTAYADEKMCDAVLRNLVLNAVKFTQPDGHITVSAVEKGGSVEISVRDSGVGMKQETLERLFKVEKPFTTKGTANETGSGLGLILCKEFVEKNQGRIWVESEENKGATFTFSLPKNVLSYRY